MPSTMLNILDLLANWKSVTKMNEDVSRLYIAYQVHRLLILNVKYLILIYTDGNNGWDFYWSRRYLHDDIWVNKPCVWN